MRNLIIAAHPDDEILGCGGVIAKNCREEDFYVLILTGGAESRYDASMKTVLRDNALKANRIVGSRQVFFEDLPNQRLDDIPLTTIIQCIEKYIDKVKPDTIFTHSNIDLNLDHRVVYNATITAARPVPGQIVKRLYSYFVASSSEWNRDGGCFIPNVYVDIEETIDKKIQAMKCYKSEIRPYPHPRYPESISTYAAFWGINVGMHFAEPFELIRDISGDLYG